MFIQAQTTLKSIIYYELVDGNPLWRFGVLVLFIALTMAAAKIIQFLIQRYSEKIKAKFGESILTHIAEALSKPVYLAVLGKGIAICEMPLYFNDKDGISTSIEASWDRIASIVIAIAIAYAMYRLVDVAEYYLRKAVGKAQTKTQTKLDTMLVQIVGKSLRVAITIIAALLIAENVLGEKNIKSLLLSAGVGGIAIAFAAKETIANFFGSITIFADRPFHIDDTIKIGQYTGTVEEVGFRSSRIRTFEGHLVTIPNSTMANEMIENIGKRPSIRRISNITITYDTGSEKTQKAINIIKEIIACVPEINSDSANLPKVYFSDFNDSSLNIYMCYWVKPADYWTWMQINEKINFEILKRFDAEKIEFAFPTQTLYVKKTL
jgi:MscS family membrane protein